MVVPRKHRTVVENTHPCGICKAQPFKYICPRCNLRYCSLTCYKDQSHVQCTESFYKSSVMDELKSSPAATPQDRKKMLGILDRFERQAVDEEQFLTMSDGDILQHAQQKQQQQQQKGAASERSGGGGTGTEGTSSIQPQQRLTPKEREELLRRAMKEEAKEDNLADDENMDPEERAEMERMVEQEYQDFVDRFADVDLDSESFESIWERLNPDERREFQEKFMISGRLDEGDDDQDEDTQGQSGDDGEKVRGVSDDDNEDEEREAKELLQEMGETLERGGQKVGGNEGVVGGASAGGQAMTADLDMDDLKAIRDAEIAELIQIWRPWWEIEAEESGQLKKVIVSKVANSEVEKQDSDRLKAASHIVLDEGGTSSAIGPGAGNIPNKSRPTSNAVLEQYVLDEEACFALIRPWSAL
ncbi:hypothetical protein BGZ95_003567 [Linnemannia exigua]|uniref:HIT-type domain-containing protein n=1 Tax=Linnemannia exigua TaxID=604196 RepID=A0AAD4DHW6_9FUNG|nr:hypothetical protein BGZ95_003567 [Linnemannia exigua]